MTTNPDKRHVPRPETSVIDWLLDSDPSIRWQAMRDLTDAPAAEIAAERARVATEGWGTACQAGGGWLLESGHAQPRVCHPPGAVAVARHGLDPASEQARRAVERVRDNVTWQGVLPQDAAWHGRPLENVHPDQLDAEPGAEEGQPSRWNTLRALRVLDWYTAGA